MQNQEFSFMKEIISDPIKSRILGISYPLNCSLSLEYLRYIEIKHYDFDGNIKTGELIVNVTVADDIIHIFQELFEVKYPIEKMILIDEYNGNDEKSMEDNNSSSFNYRTIDSNNTLSLHSYGLAIDINPLYNPYVRTGFGDRNILPKNGLIYTDRVKDFPGKIDKQDICYQLFTKNGWKWGGDWSHAKDYQHFYFENY